MIGDVFLNVVLSVGLAYAGFRSFQTYKVHHKKNEGSAIPVQESDPNVLATVLWLQFWVVFSVLRVLEASVSQRFEAAQFLLVASVFVDSQKTRTFVEWVYTRLVVPALKYVDIVVLPQIVYLSSLLLSHAFKFTRVFHTYIVRISLRTLTDGELGRVEETLKQIATVAIKEKKLRRIEDFKKSQRKISEAAARVSYTTFNDDGDAIPPAPSSTITRPLPPQEVNLDQGGAEDSRNPALRQRRGSRTAKQGKRSRVTLGVSPFDAASRGRALFKDT
jgi:hypothetical protein